MFHPIARRMLLAVAVGVSACAPLPKAEPLTALSDAVLHDTQGWQQGQAEWPAAEWWSGFDDPQLSAVVKTILAANPSLQVARLHATAAVAIAEGQRGQLSPQVGVKAAPAREQISANGMFPAPFGGQTFTLFDLAGSLTYRLDLSGSVRAQAQSKAADAVAVQEDARRTEQVMATTAARLYFELASAITDQAYVEELQTLYGEQRRLLAVRAAHGLDAEAATRHLMADVDAFAQWPPSATERTVRARAVLAALAGAGPDSMQAVSARLGKPNLLTAVPADLRLGLLSRRADVRAAQARVEAAGYDRFAAHQAYLPDLSFQVLGGLQSRTLGSLFESGSREWNVGPALSLPIFDGRQRKAAMKAEDARFQAVRLQYQETVVKAIEDVTIALAARDAAARSLAAARQALAEEQQSLASLKRRQAAGISAETDVVTARIRVVERNREVARQIARSNLADVDLIEALGGDAREEPTR